MMNKLAPGVMKAWVSRLTVIFTFILLAHTASAISVKDSTAFGMPVFVIDWTDNDGKPRKVAMVKDSYSNKTGVCVFMRYYVGNTPVNIQSYDPSAADPWNSGFGCTVHHNYTNDEYHVGGTLTIKFQGDHHVVFEWIQTVNGATETVHYTFMDGLDYFQWQNTVDARTGTKTADSRGPYSSMMWNEDWTAVDGQEYAAEKYFTQDVYNGPWTFTGDATNDIPFVRQWDGDKEAGYVQTQTFNQQLAGNPNWGGSWNLESSGSAVDNFPYSTTTSGDDDWAFDFQMNFYDQAKKITWGMPYGYMNNGEGDGQHQGASTGNKDGWGQYSLSIIFDALAENGVRRVRDENRAIHDGTVSLTAIKGTVVTTGPVGTANPATQTLSPAGYDHNYRAWWIEPDGTGEAEMTFDAGTSTLKNPTFRIKNMSDVPGLVKYNTTTLVEGTDYYASYNAATQEAWVTILRDVTGTNTVYFLDGNLSGIVISAASVTPASVYNNVSNDLDFSVTVTDDGSISSVTLNLTSIGGGAAVPMTLGGGNTWTHTYNLASGASTGTKTIVATVTDNLSNTKTVNITLDVLATYEYQAIYTDAETMVTGTWVAPAGATLTEQNGAGAVEGTKDYDFSGSTTGWFAGFGLNLSNWNDANAKDFSTWESLLFSYKASSDNATVLNVSFGGPGDVSSTPKSYSLSAAYSDISMPLTGFFVADANGASTGVPFDLSKVITITFSLGGAQTFSGTINVDNVRLSKAATAEPEMNVKVGVTSIASAGTHNFGSVVAGSSGSAVTFTIENTGMADLNLSGSPKIAISGADQSSFVISQTSTSATVSASGTTTFTITFSPSSAGTKNAQISIANNDSDESPYVINLTGSATTSTGVKGILNAERINVYPNPFTSDFTISLDGISGESTVKVLDEVGKPVKQVSGKGDSSIRMEMEELPAGMYFLEISTPEGTGVKKIYKY